MLTDDQEIAQMRTMTTADVMNAIQQCKSLIASGFLVDPLERQLRLLNRVLHERQYKSV